MRMKLILVFSLAVTVFIFNGNVVEAQVPEIIHSIPRDSSGYGGGVTCYPLTEDLKYMRPIMPLAPGLNILISRVRSMERWKEVYRVCISGTRILLMIPREIYSGQLPKEAL